MTIRKARSSDLESVTNVEAACFPAAEAASREEFQERIQTFSDSFFVAEESGNVIGFINGGVSDQMVIADEFFHDVSMHDPYGAYQTVFGLDVLPSYQRQGIASKLMAHLIESAREAGRKGVILTCKEALIPFYEAFDFQNQGLSASTHGGSVWYDMLLSF